MVLRLKNKRFGRLVGIEPTIERKDNKIIWLFKCDCGNLHKTTGKSVVQGLTNSCGCLAIDTIKKMSTKHGLRYTSEYKAWRGMMDRCCNPKKKSWPRYGGRGIKVCDEWKNSFEAFFKYMGFKPHPKLTLERINNNGNYEPGNCKWATYSEQALNRSTSRANKLKKERVSI